MADVFDIALDTVFDVRIEKGDFVVAECTKQHQELLLLANKGQFKQHPTIGVGIDTYLNDEASTTDLKRVIQEQYEIDGMRIIRMSGTQYSNIQVDAYYGTEDSTNIR